MKIVSSGVWTEYRVWSPILVIVQMSSSTYYVYNPRIYLIVILDIGNWQPSYLADNWKIKVLKWNLHDMTLLHLVMYVVFMYSVYRKKQISCFQTMSSLVLFSGVNFLISFRVAKFSWCNMRSYNCYGIYVFSFLALPDWF